MHYAMSCWTRIFQRIHFSCIFMLASVLTSSPSTLNNTQHMKHPSQSNWEANKKNIICLVASDRKLRKFSFSSYFWSTVSAFSRELKNTLRQGISLPSPNPGYSDIRKHSWDISMSNGLRTYDKGIFFLMIWFLDEPKNLWTL